MAKDGDPQVEAAKMASLGLVWAVLAGIAYLGIIHWAVDMAEKNGLQGPTIATEGLRSLHPSTVGVPAASLFTLVIEAIPFAIGAVILLTILGRVRPGFVAGPVVLILAALVGLIGVVLLFLTIVNTPGNRLGFLIALGTIISVSILLRLERYVRRLHRRSPAVSTLLLALVVIIYLVAYNSANISTLVLGQIDIWLALVAFAIVLYAAINLLRQSIRL